MRRAKRLILELFRLAGYELLKSSDPRVQTFDNLRPHGPVSALDVALDIVRQRASDPKVAATIFDAVLASAVVPHHRSVFWGDRLLTLDKSAGFKDNPRFATVMREVASDTGATQYRSLDGIAWRLNTLVWAAHDALRVPGDFVECGVYHGDMSWVVSDLVDIGAAGRTFYLYDTFEGFSPQYSSSADFPAAPEFFSVADRGYRTPGLYETVCGRFASKPYVKVIKGVVPDILYTVAPRQIAFLHVDMNSARPEIGALELLFDRVSSGGLIVFDDYGWLLHKRQKDAHDGFMAARGYEILELPTGQGLLLKR